MIRYCRITQKIMKWIWTRRPKYWDTNCLKNTAFQHGWPQNTQAWKKVKLIEKVG
jgi:hypothetical protein